MDKSALKIMYTCSVANRRQGNKRRSLRNMYKSFDEANFSILGVPVHQLSCFFFLTGLKFHVDLISLYKNIHK